MNFVIQFITLRHTTAYTYAYIQTNPHIHKKGKQHEDLLAYTMEVISNKINGHLFEDMEETKKNPTA